MYRSLVLKELRELAGIIALAIFAYAAILIHFTTAPVIHWMIHWRYIDPGRFGDQEIYPFASGSFVEVYIYVTAAMMIACGFRQTLWEENLKTWVLLLHRPVARYQIILTKLAVGLGVCLFCSSLTILIYGLWARYLRHAPAPFEWAMMSDTSQLCLSLPLVYLGTFLSGFRPARWIGSRLAPLLMGIILTTLLSVISFYPFSLLITISAPLFVIAILFTLQTRDLA